MIEPNIQNLRTLELQECMYESLHCVILFSRVTTLPFLTVYKYYYYYYSIENRLKLV